MKINAITALAASLLLWSFASCPAIVVDMATSPRLSIREPQRGADYVASPIRSHPGCEGNHADKISGRIIGLPLK